MDEKSNESAPKKTPANMLINKCPHTHRKHYAKNMCASCYRKNGKG